MIEPRFPTTLPRCHDEIRRLAARIEALDAELAYLGNQDVAWAEGRTLGLSPSEAAIYAALARNRNRVTPKARLLAALEDANGSDTASDAVLKVHISRMRHKLPAEDFVGVWGVGYIMSAKAGGRFRGMDDDILRVLEDNPRGCALHVVSRALKREQNVVGARLRAMQKRGEVEYSYATNGAPRRYRVWQKAHNQVA